MTDRWVRAAAALLATILLQRVVILLAVPDLLHDWDAGELKHLDLALFGLPAVDGDLFEALRRWLSAPENIHHGGYVVVSVGYAALSAVFGDSLFLLRCLPLLASMIAAWAAWAFVRRRVDDRAALLVLGLFAGAPPILLKWSLTARGGHTEAIFLLPVVALLCDRALRDDRPRSWLLAAAMAGFGVYFTYLAAPIALGLGVAALAERGLRDRGPGFRRAVGFVLLGGAIGFGPWLFGWIVLDLPYFDATIHATAAENEASEVLQRGVVDLLRGVVVGLPHNLWAWTTGIATAPAYLAEVPDQLDYEPNGVEWAARGVVCGAVLAGFVAAIRRRSPVLIGIALLPALHHVFVVRLANQGGWPEIPHRYLVIAFPAVAMAASVGVASLPGRLRAMGEGALVLVMLSALAVTVPWMGAPAPTIDIVALRDNSLGRIHADEADEMVALLAELDADDPDHQQSTRRGVGLVYAPIADYFLLFRTDRTRPYPVELFGREDPLSDTDARRAALVRGALRATVLRAEDDAERDAWLCSWRPRPEFEGAVRQVLAEAKLRPACP